MATDKIRIVMFGWAQSVHVQRWVTGLRDRGFLIKLISLGGRPIDDVETVNIPYGSKYKYLLTMARAAREAREFKPDLVHVHYAGGYGLWGLRTGHRPTIVSVWGSDLSEMSERWYTRRLLLRILNRATWVTATSNYLRRGISELAPETANHLSTIPFGITVPAETKPFPPSPPVRLCFLKLHLAVYGPDLLVAAMAAVAKVNPEIELSIAGEGPMTPVLNALIADLHLQNQVKIVGYIENRNVYEFIRQHHIIVMPSLSEGFGVAAIEASACGRPVIASNVGGVPEVVQDGRTGLLVPPGNVAALAEAINRLSRDLPMQERMGKAGYEFVSANYDWAKSLDQMSELYQRIVYESRKNSIV